MHDEVYLGLARLVASRGRGALVTLVRASGSTPQRVGAKLLVLPDGSTIGTIGGGCYENEAVQRARQLLADGGQAVLARFDLNDDVAAETGLICGGQMDVFIEPIVPAPDLYVVGAGHVGVEVARLAAHVGFRVHVIDDRERFANRERCPEASEIVVADVPSWLTQAELPGDGYAVILTRGHRHDLEALRALASRPLVYLGLIGSRAKVARLFEVLRDEGVAEDALARVYSPIGLDIGAVTPEEIAVAIVAELIAVRHGRTPAVGGEDERSGRTGTAARSLRWSPPAKVATADPSRA